MLRLWMRGLYAGAALFGVCVAALGGASWTLLGGFWGLGLLACAFREVVHRRSRLSAATVMGGVA